MQSHIRKVYACLAVTCHLHFWQNDRGPLRATVVTRGWNGYRNKIQHRKLTLEKKILPPLLQGFEPVTFRSRVRRSNHWAISVPIHTIRCHRNAWSAYRPVKMPVQRGQNQQTGELITQYKYTSTITKTWVAYGNFHLFPRRRSEIPGTFYTPFYVTNTIRIIRAGSYEANEPRISNRKGVLSYLCPSLCVCSFQTFDLDLVSE